MTVKLQATRGLPGRREFLGGLTALGAGSLTRRAESPALNGQKQAGTDDRAYWVDVLDRVARSVLTNLAARRLRETMPTEAAPGMREARLATTYCEAFGKLSAGIAPWLELQLESGEEGRLRRQYAELARQAMSAATDPRSPDRMDFAQALVSAAYLAQAIIRAPNELWRKLDPKARRDLVAALKATRAVKPNFNNWLLFSATVEAALCLMGEEWDRMRVDYAVRQHEQWYVGDGLYGDGPEFHWDYYNSFVIHPLLVDVLNTVSSSAKDWETLRPAVMKRARRYAAIQERLISPEGTFPAVGRSLAYRFAVFHLLGQMALLHELPEGVTPGQVRSALTAVIRRMIEAPGTFDAAGWLRIGFCGHQPAIGERYISTGSLYFCAVGLLPLGLPPEDEFWRAAPADWSARRAWSGQNVEADQAI